MPNMCAPQIVMSFPDRNHTAFNPPPQRDLLRVNEEMKVAAAKYMREQERAKADKEEKMTKFRDAAADAAARTIQQMYYVFSVSFRSTR